MWTEPESLDDVLSLVLSRVGLESFLTCAFDVGSASAIAFPKAAALRFKVILRGECWLSVEGIKTPYRLRAGDCFLISERRGFVLSTDLATTANMPADKLIHSRNADGVIVHAGGGEIFSIGAVFRFHGQFARIILQSLPVVIHLPSDLDEAAVLRWSIERFTAEFRGSAPGRAFFMANLAPIILLQTLRVHTSLNRAEESWLGALAHPKLAKAIEAIHTAYGDDWSVSSLAALSGMSRASFAQTFKKFVGASPIEYLLRWRMHMACALIEERKFGLGEIARQVGFASESAFSAAFKRVLGIRPGNFKKGQILDLPFAEAPEIGFPLPKDRAPDLTHDQGGPR